MNFIWLRPDYSKTYIARNDKFILIKSYVFMFHYPHVGFTAQNANQNFQQLQPRFTCLAFESLIRKLMLLLFMI